jgi:hypothetical protein
VAPLEFDGQPFFEIVYMAMANRRPLRREKRSRTEDRDHASIARISYRLPAGAGDILRKLQ